MKNYISYSLHNISDNAVHIASTTTTKEFSNKELYFASVITFKDRFTNDMQMLYIKNSINFTYFVI